MFRATMFPSSGETTVFMRHLVIVILYGWLSGMQGADQAVIHTASHKYSCLFWWWACKSPETCSEKKTYQENFAPSWLYLQDCHTYLEHYRTLKDLGYNHLNFFFRWHYRPLWALACRDNTSPFFHIYHQLSLSSHSQNFKISFYFSLSFPESSSSSRPFHFLSEGILGILSSSIPSRWPSQLILCPVIHFTIFS